MHCFNFVFICSHDENAGDVYLVRLHAHIKPVYTSFNLELMAQSLRRFGHKSCYKNVCGSPKNFRIFDISEKNYQRPSIKNEYLVYCSFLWFIKHTLQLPLFYYLLTVEVLRKNIREFLEEPTLCYQIFMIALKLLKSRKFTE